MVTGLAEPAGGTPEIVPVCESRISPVGSCPETIVQVSAPELPCAWSVRLKATVRTHWTVAFVLIVITSDEGGGGGGGGVEGTPPQPHTARRHIHRAQTEGR